MLTDQQGQILALGKYHQKKTKIFGISLGGGQKGQILKGEFPKSRGVFIFKNCLKYAFLKYNKNFTLQITYWQTSVLSLEVDLKLTPIKISQQQQEEQEQYCQKPNLTST